MNKPLPTQQRLHELFYLVGGRLIRKIGLGCNQYSKRGTEAGYYHKDGRLQVTVDGIVYQLPRVIYMWQFGIDPGEMDVDHIDDDSTNNDIWNLQLLTPDENDRKGGKGYSKLSSGRYRAIIRLNGKRKHLGCYDTEEEARAAYEAALKDRYFYL